MLATAVSKDEARVLYFATTRDQARDIAWADLKKIAKEITHKINETNLELTIINRYGGYSLIKLSGYENVETQRGKQYDLIVADEVAKMRNFLAMWSTVLRPTLAFRQGSALFISTPRGYNDFHTLYQYGRDHTLPDWESFHFTSYDNPHLPVSEIEAAKMESTPDFFAQEWMAEFTRFTGLVYQEFSEEHVHFFDTPYEDYGDYLFGMDFAVRGYTAAMPVHVRTDGHIYILDNYKEDNLTALDHGPKIKNMLTKYSSFDKYVGFADPAGWINNQQGIKNEKPMTWSLADEYLEMDFPIAPANNEVIAGINYVRQLFKQNRIHIHPRCTKLIDELYQYQWKDQTKQSMGETSEPESVRKINDHLVDSMRYVLYSKPEAPPPVATHLPGMPIVFGAPKIDLSEDKPQDVVEFPSVYDL